MQHSRRQPPFARDNRAMYAVKEIFYTLQGEGANTGTPGGVLPLRGMQPVVGARGGQGFGHLQLLRYGFRRDRWTRRRTVRRCRSLVDAVDRAWGARGAGKFVVCTGGEPLLQLDAPLLEALTLAVSAWPSRRTAPSMPSKGSTGFA
jgi:hypothetical protein